MASTVEVPRWHLGGSRGGRRVAGTCAAPVVADAADIDNNQLKVEAVGGQDSGDCHSWD